MYYIPNNVQCKMLIETSTVNHIFILLLLEIYRLIRVILCIFYLLSIFKCINMIFLDKRIIKLF